MAEELKACPFCGQYDFLIEQLDGCSSVVICQGMVGEHSACLARGPIAIQDDDGEEQPGKDAAIREWNARAQMPSQGGEAVEVVSGDRLMLSAESKSSIYERERMIGRPYEQGRSPEQNDSVFAWAYTYGGMRELCYPSESMDQVRLGLFFGDGDAGPNPAYTDWIPLYTNPADQVADGVVVSRELLYRIKNVYAVGLTMDSEMDELRALLEPKP